MARINHSIQNTFSLLNPLYSITSKSRTTTTHLKNRLNFSKNLIFSSSASRKAQFCTCTISNSNSNIHNSAQNGEAVAAETFVLTTPLYYVNAPPHMGSAYTTIAADAIARFQRLLGKKVIFVTGTDEHGEKIAAAAAACGSSPSEHCDVISQDYRTLWKDLEISYDKFIRTTDPKHEAIVKEFYSRVLANGDIYRADYEGLYCVNCEEYKDAKELLDNNCCPMHLKPCIERKEDNYFFALSKYQKLLEETLTENPNFVQPSFRLNEVQSWIKSGLKDFSISRASVDWGIPVPNDNKQTIYVWFDALLGYISALSEDKEQPNLQNAVSSGWPASLHLIGKDILRFHAVYWPAMLMSAGLGLPKMVFGHGFLTKVDKAQIHYENLALSVACEAVLEIGNAGNAYMDERAPWSLFKQGGAASEAAAKDLVIILEAMRIIAIALSPVSPSLCWRIYAQLGYSKDHFNTLTWSETKWGGLKGGQVMAQPKPVFARIENKTETEDGEASAKKIVNRKDTKPQAKVVAEA
ncbi:methionine-tRNA synthetase, putative [Ricinus communis]|uniref:methionine--tRNA ligase n=1 Tax=Ricinus communis TaxID=3988 RepID=B9SR18_RICCO|nr:methionine-tRNA synthetase, putative [Ricinus communis]